MSAFRLSTLAVAATAGLVGLAAMAAPHEGAGRAPGASSPAHGSFRPGPSSGHRPGYPGRPGGHHSGGHSYWGWGLGLALTAPWALGWSDPWGGSPWYGPYPSYAYGPPYRYAYPGVACEQDEDCWRARTAPAEPAAPTTVAPVVPNDAGAPTERPLHLNYCDSAKAWFPHVRSCPEGWRLVRPQYP